jgi:hypothetical protein
MLAEVSMLAERRPHYWALLAKPRFYDLEAVLSQEDEDVWVVDGHDIRRGDRVALWRGMKDGQRGILALAEVLSDPNEMDVPKHLKKYWKVPPFPGKRVWVRFVRPPGAPLWLNSERGQMLYELTISRGQGTVFRIKPAQWARMLNALGGWRDVADISLKEYDYQIAVSDSIVERRVRSEQGLLRRVILRDREHGTCVICGRKFPVDLLVAAHIKRRSQCSEEEKCDLRNLVPMCKLGCDDLFERGYVGLADGQLIMNKTKLESATDAVVYYLEGLTNRVCDHWERGKRYFEWHRAWHEIV